jgi:2-C-methyl-D-erythritol 2,4-cyclodiphosphate synthase
MIRVGIGYDSHRFAPPGPLVLGGVSIPSDVRLAGHSDGDAICHALTDAVLGAVALGDIGEMFPDTDPANAGRSSTEMLRLAIARVKSAGWHVSQVDVIVVTERPKIGLYREQMRTQMAYTLECQAGSISIKGKTNEGMGWIGRGEGLACMAVATLSNE